MAVTQITVKVFFIIISPNVILYIFETQFFTVFIFTGEFVDNTDNIISLTISFINLCIKLLHSSSLTQFSYVPVIP